MGERNASVGDRIVKASLVVSVAHLSCKLLGFVQAIVVGSSLGGKDFDAVYGFAFEGVIMTLFYIGEEVIGPSFLPVFMREMDLKEERDGWVLANVLLTIQLLLLGGAVFLVACFPDQVIHLLTYWREAKNPERYALARSSVVWLAPSLFGFSMASTTYILLNGYKRFFLAAFGDASWKLSVLAAVLVGMWGFGWDHRALVFGLLAGSLAKLGTHLLGLLRQLRFVRPSLAVGNPAFRTMVLLMLPMIAGILFAKYRDLFNNVTVLSFLDTPGLLKANSFGRKLYGAISWLVPYAVSIAMFPFFCELVDRGDREKLGRIMTASGRMMLSVFLPGALLIAVMSQPLAMLLFRYGEFDAATVRWAALSNACYIFVLPAQSLEVILMQGYFANRKMWSVTAIGIGFSALSVAISYIAIVRFGVRGVDGLTVVALSYVVSRTLKTVTLAAVLKRAVPMFPLGPTVWFVVRVLALGAAVGAAGYGASTGIGAVWRVDPEAATLTTKLALLARLATGGAAGGVLFWAAAWALRVQEPFEMLRWGWEKVLRRVRPTADTAPPA